MRALPAGRIRRSAILRQFAAAGSYWSTAKGSTPVNCAGSTLRSLYSRTGVPDASGPAKVAPVFRCRHSRNRLGRRET